MSTLTLESFVASVVLRQYRKLGGLEWDNSTIPIRFILLSEKQTRLYESLLEQKIRKIEKIKTWSDGTFHLYRDVEGRNQLIHKSGMAFSYTFQIKGKSFQVANYRTKQTFWMKNEGQSYMHIKLYKPIKN